MSLAAGATCLSLHWVLAPSALWQVLDRRTLLSPPLHALHKMQSCVTCVLTSDVGLEQEICSP